MMRYLTFQEKLEQRPFFKEDASNEQMIRYLRVTNCFFIYYDLRRFEYGT